MGHGAVLVSRWFSKHLPGEAYPFVPDGDVRYGRRWPFQNVFFEWPDDVELREPKDELDNDLPPECVKGWWLRAKCSEDPIKIRVTAVDRLGKTHRFEMPLMLLRPDIAKDQKLAQTYLDYFFEKCEALRSVDFGGQMLGYVPKGNSTNNDSASRGAYPTQRVRFNVELIDEDWHAKKFPPYDVGSPARPSNFPEPWWSKACYYPAIAQAEIRLSEVEAYSARGGGNTTVAWNPTFSAFGFAAGRGNGGELFLDIIDGSGNSSFIPMVFSGEKGGGVVSPSQDIVSLSRLIGTVGGKSSRDVKAKLDANNLSQNPFANKQFDPAQFLPLDATLIGGIKLKDVLSFIQEVASLNDVPQLSSESFPDIREALAQINEIAGVIDRIASLTTSFEPGLVATLKQMGNQVKSDLESRILKPFKDTFVLGLAERLRQSNDQDGVMSFHKTFLILVDSLKGTYPLLDLNTALIRLKELSSVRRLVDNVLREPVIAITTEIAAFNPLDVLTPKDRLTEITKSLRNPDSLFDGSFFDAIRRQLASLGIGQGGLTAVFLQLIDAFRSRVHSALLTSAQHFEDAVKNQTVGALKDYLQTNFPDAISPAHSPGAAIRLSTFEEYVEREITEPMHSATRSVIDAFDEIVSQIPFDEIKPILMGADVALVRLREEIESALEDIEKWLAEIPRSISIPYKWDTELQSGPSGFEIFVASNLAATKKARLTFSSVIEKKLGFSKESLLSKPTARTTTKLTNFQLVLIPNAEFLRVGVNELLIESNGSSKPIVKVDIESVEFSDALEFVQQIASLFSPDSGFQIGVTPSGISAGYRFGVPDFSVGVFNLADLALGVDLILPFDGRPLALGFNVSDRDKPCLVSIGVLGGTAFFRIALEARDGGGAVTELEAAVEFGAVVAASLGPASGRLYVFGGVYYGRNGDAITFRGYVRAGGCLDVLGLITISAEFYLALVYRKVGANTEVFGEARITVRVKIMFVINTRVTIVYRKQFQGSKSETRRVESRPVAIGFMASPLSTDNSDSVDAHVAIPVAEWRKHCSLFA
jgi:hypothetical protein